MKLSIWCAIIGILLTLAYSSACAQGRIDVFLIDGDTLYMMDREYAEFVASRFDSLEDAQIYLRDCQGIVEDLSYSLRTRADLIASLNHRIDNQVDEIYVLEHKIKSYQRTDRINQELNQSLVKQIKRRKVWTGLAIGGISVGFAGVLYAVLK